MTDGSIEYKLGNISARLDENDRVHAEISNCLYNVQCSIDRVEVSLSSSREDIASIKGKASIWGAIMGVFASTLITVIGWIFYIIRR